LIGPSFDLHAIIALHLIQVFSQRGQCKSCGKMG
jgi:hypothetical protein